MFSIVYNTMKPSKSKEYLRVHVAGKHATTQVLFAAKAFIFMSI